MRSTADRAATTSPIIRRLLAAVSIDVATGGSNGYGGTDAFGGIESVNGSAFADTLTGDGNANTFRGNGGDDVLAGAAGSDTAAYVGQRRRLSASSSCPAPTCASSIGAPAVPTAPMR